MTAVWASGSEEDVGSELVDALGLGYGSDDASDSDALQQGKPELEISNAAVAAPAEVPDGAAVEADRSDEAKADTSTEVAHNGIGTTNEKESGDNLDLDVLSQQASPAAEETAAEEAAVAASGNAEETAAVSVEEPAAKPSARVDDTPQNANGAAASFSKGDRLGCTALFTIKCQFTRPY